MRILEERKKIRAAKKLAKHFGLSYINRVLDSEEKNHKKIDFSNRCYMKKNRYICFYPPNDGKHKCKADWYCTCNDHIVKVMDNQEAFANITNLNEILRQMVNIYVRYIDNEKVSINPYGFAISLEDEVTSNYVGKAKLVVTSDSIILDTENKAHYLNEFLDRFIGFNFGIVISNDSLLENKLNHLNDLVIQRSMREYHGEGYEVICTEKIKQYELRTGVYI